MTYLSIMNNGLRCLIKSRNYREASYFLESSWIPNIDYPKARHMTDPKEYNEACKILHFLGQIYQWKGYLSIRLHENPRYYRAFFNQADQVYLEIMHDGNHFEYAKKRLTETAYELLLMKIYGYLMIGGIDSIYWPNQPDRFFDVLKERLDFDEPGYSGPTVDGLERLSVVCAKYPVLRKYVKAFEKYVMETTTSKVTKRKMIYFKNSNSINEHFKRKL